MKRWIRRIVLCLLLGALTTIAVAWSCTLLIMKPITLYPRVRDVRASDLIRSYTDFDPDRVRSFEMLVFDRRESGTRLLAIRCVPRAGPLGRISDSIDLAVRKSGWPLFSFEGSYAIIFDRTSESVVHRRYSALVPRAERLDDNILWFLPLRPIFPGFLINTLFYAAIWFGLFFGLSAARRTIRRRRGRCPMCGYDLRGDLARGCSECGWNREP